MTEPQTTPEERRPRLTHQPALDGVRAVAVLVVMLYHSGPTWFDAGFLGVDIFLVLSGFLITLLLVQEIERSGTVNRRAFWGRRARRLLPAVFAVLIAVALYAAFAATATERATIRGDSLASLFYVQNWHLIFTHQSYFAQFGTPSPLRHMWSLAIEEQWYLVWPLLFLGMFRLCRGNLARIAGITAALAAASAVLMVVIYDPTRDPSRVYYGTDTRAQALLIGALLAFLFAWRPPGVGRLGRLLVNVVGAAGSLYLLWTMVQYNDGTHALYTGGLTWVALAAAALIAASMTKGPIRWLLSLPPLPAIGLISYGLYLWHWPLYVFLSAERTGFHERALLILRFAVTFVVATASYFWLERPVRRQQWRWVRSPGRWIPISAVVVIGATVFATASILPSRSEAAEAGLTDAQLARYAAAVSHREKGLPADKVRVLLAGDSVAFTLDFWGIPERFRKTIAVDGAAILGCGVARGDLVSDGVRQAGNRACQHWPRHYAEQVKEDDPDVSMLLIGAWEVYDRVVDGKTIKFGTPAMQRQLDADLDTARQTLTSNGAHLILLTTPCYSPDRQGFGTWGEQERSEPWRVGWLNDVLRRYAQAHPEQVSLADLKDQVCPKGKYVEKLHGKQLRTDGVHFAKGARDIVWSWLAPIAEQTAIAHPHRQIPPPPTSSTTTTTGPPITGAAPPPPRTARGSPTPGPAAALRPTG